MYEYRVVERWADQGLCALQCNLGRYHLARALHFMPPEDVPLSGDKPRLGFGILQCTASGAIFRVIFESINDAQPSAGASRTQSGPLFLEWSSFAAAGRDD